MLNIPDLEGFQPTHLEQCLMDYCNDVKRLYTQNLEADGRRATGNLINSIDVNVNALGLDLVVTISVLDYWQYTENGRGAGKWPPRDKILEWVRVKGLPTRENSGYGGLPTEQQLAFLIQRKIGREGYQGKPSLANTMEELNSIYKEKFQLAIQQDFNIFGQGILDNIVNALL